MTTIVCADLKEWAKTLRKDLKGREKRCSRAQRKTASRIVPYMRQNTIPKAFGELGDSIHIERTATGAMVVVDAPHASAVENGSRPHVVPIEALLKWVKLRGMQGLRSPSSLKGTTTRGHAQNIARQIKDHERTNGSVDTDVPLQIAYAIQHAIAMKGTRPHHYMLKTQPKIMEYLDYYLAEAMEPQDLFFDPDAGFTGDENG